MDHAIPTQPPTRGQIDNPYRRLYAEDSYLKRQFGGSRVTTDQYTGKKLFISANGVGKGRSDPRHFTTSTTVNVDHVVPIQSLIERYGDKLSVEDLRRIANADYNLALTSEQINKQKQQMSNWQLVKKKLESGEDVSPDTVARLLGREAYAEGRVRVDVALARAGYAVRDGAVIAMDAAQAGTSAALMALTVSSISNLALVAAGEKDLKDGIKDIACAAGNSFVSAAGTKAAQDIVGLVVKQAKSAGLKKLAAAELPTAQIAMAAMIAGSVKRLADGDISAEDCALEILLNGAGSLAYQMGMAVGGPVVAFVVSAVVSQISAAIVTCKQDEKLARAKEAELNSILCQASAELETQKKRFKEYVTAEQRRWDEMVDKGYETFFHAMANDDVEGAADGLNMILSLFDSQVLYTSLDAFKKDFLSPDAPALVL